MQAEEIITPAKKQIFPHVGPQSVSDAALLSSLGTMDKQFVYLIAQAHPDSLSTRVDSVSVTDSKNENGYRLKEGSMYRDFKYIDQDDEVTRISLVRYEDLERAPDNPAGAVVQDSIFDAGRFYPADPLGKRWAGTESRQWYEAGEDKIAYSYIPEPTTPTSLSDDLGSPRVAQAALTAYVVMQALLSQPGVPEARLQAAVQAFQSARQTMLMQIYKRVLNDKPSDTSIRRFRSDLDGLP